MHSPVFLTRSKRKQSAHMRHKTHPSPANHRPPVYTVRLNPFRAVGGVGPLLERLRAAGVDAQPSPLLPTSFVEVRSGLQALLAEVGADGRGLQASGLASGERV